jgi:hypothetical protein
MITRDIFAGIDTSEWAYERDDMRPLIRHSRASVFDSSPNNEGKFFLSHRHLATISLGGKHVINRVSINKIPNTVPLKVWKDSLYNSDALRNQRQRS